MLLYLALNWLVVERLTLPDVLDGVGGLSSDDLLDALVQRISCATAELGTGLRRPG